MPVFLKLLFISRKLRTTSLKLRTSSFASSSLSRASPFPLPRQDASYYKPYDSRVKFIASPSHSPCLVKLSDAGSYVVEHPFLHVFQLLPLLLQVPLHEPYQFLRVVGLDEVRIYLLVGCLDG